MSVDELAGPALFSIQVTEEQVTNSESLNPNSCRNHEIILTCNETYL